MTAGKDTEFGSEGSAAKIALSWTTSDELRSLRNTQTGSGQDTSGYDANNTYGISNWTYDAEGILSDVETAFGDEGQDGILGVVDDAVEGKYTGVNEGATEVYRPQVTVATGLRNISGIREGIPMSRAADVSTVLQEKVAALLTDSGDRNSQEDRED